MTQWGKINLLPHGIPGLEKEYKEEFYRKRVAGRSLEVSLRPRTERGCG